MEVKRIIKGGNVINTLPGINRFNPWQRKMVMVDGIGDPHICKSKARKYDTRIFMLNKNGNGELKLNGSLVRLTLHNLEVADAAVKGRYLKGTLPFFHIVDRNLKAHFHFFTLLRVS